MDPLVSQEHNLTMAMQAVEMALLKHEVAACNLGRSLKAHLEDLVGYRGDGR